MSPKQIINRLFLFLSAIIRGVLWLKIRQTDRRTDKQRSKPELRHWQAGCSLDQIAACCLVMVVAEKIGQIATPIAL